MPKTYPPEAVREACSLYMSGLGYEDVAKHMRNNGYASYSTETIKRWAKERGWEDQRAKIAAEEGAMLAALDSARMTAEMLNGLVKLRGELEQKRVNGEVDFMDALRVQLQINAQIRMTLAQLKAPREKEDAEAQEKAPELSLEEILENVYGIPRK
jgi:hypothetical protein